MPARASTDVSQLAGPIQLREATTALNKNTSPRSFTTMPELGCEIAVAAAHRKQNPVNQLTGFHARSIRERTRELSDKCKSNPSWSSCP